MDSLPTELLQAVFETFVLVFCEHPRILCSISRKWRITALHTPKVWSRIAVAHETRRLAVNRIPDASYTICETENRLKTILTRAGSVKLDVYIGAYPLNMFSDAWTTIDKEWLAKRCRKLTLWGQVLADDPWVRNLAELEEVVFTHEYSTFNKLCKDMQTNSPKLFSMDLRVTDVPKLAQIRALAARLRVIRVFRETYLGHVDNNGEANDEEMVLVRLPQFNCVEELLWVDLMTGNTFPQTTNRLRVLTIRIHRYLDSDRAEWSSLTELRLVGGPLSIHPTQRSVVLPALETLILDGIWVELPRICAPALRVLRLLKGVRADRGDQRRKALLDCTLRPSILYVEMCISTMTLLFMLQGVWSGIQELHCTSHLSDDLLQLPEELVGHLSRTWFTHGKAQICQRLSAFTTLLVSKSRADLYGDAITVTSAMQIMVQNRSSTHPLTVALLGLKSSNSYGDSTQWSSFA